jgi:hypothetical protein
MEAINYTSAILWFSLWPVVIYVSYRFVLTNITHLEENLEEKMLVEDKKAKKVSAIDNT